MDLFLYFFRSYPWRTILVFVAVTIASIVTAASLLILPALLFTLLGRNSAKTQFINDAFLQIGVNPSTENLIYFFLAGIVIQNILLGGANIYAGFTRAKVIKDLRIKLLTTMSQTEWAFFIKQSTGVFTAALVNEVENAGNGYETMVGILSNAVQLLAYLSVAFFISWQIAVIAIITGIVLTMLFGKLILVSKEFGAEGTYLIREITARLTDSYRSIKPLKAMSRESHSHALLSTYTKKLKEVARKGTIASELLDSLQDIILMCAIIFTIYFSFKYLDIPLELSIILVILYLRSMKLFAKSQKQYQAFLANVSGYDMVIDSMKNALDHREHRTGTRKHTLKGNIEFRNVTFKHDHKTILNNASATFYHHKLNSIVGPSGEGKTTTVDLICGLYQSSLDSILIDEIPLSEIDIAFWREQIGYVTQEHNLLNTSIKNNITLGDPIFSENQIDTALQKAHCTSFLQELPYGIETGVGENGAYLSGGQRQRVLIARAIIHSPKLLILDEATSALDSQTEKSLSEMFRELSREMTIISISHRPALINASDHIIELQDGKLIEVTL